MSVSEHEFERLATAVSGLQQSVVSLSTGQAATGQSVQTLTIAVRELGEKVDRLLQGMAVVEEREKDRKDAKSESRRAMWAGLIGLGLAAWAKMSDWFAK